MTSISVLEHELFHEDDEFVYVVSGDGVVEGGTDAAHGAMTLLGRKRERNGGRDRRGREGGRGWGEEEGKDGRGGRDGESRKGRAGREEIVEGREEIEGDGRGG